MKLYDLKAEMSLVGACLIEESIIPHVATLITPEHVYDRDISAFFGAVLDLHKKGQAVDTVTVSGHIGDKCNHVKLDACLTVVPTAVNYKSYADTITEYYRRRKLATLSGEIREQLQTGGSLETCAYVEQAISNMTATRDGEQTIQEVVSRLVKQIQENRTNQGIRTGFPAYDALINGYREGEVHILAGRPGSGKCLGKGQLVLLFDGRLIKVEDLKVGDFLMGPDSKKRKILSLCKGVGPLYKIKQKKAMEYIVNEDHILMLKNTDTKKIIEISVKEFIKKSERFRTRNKGYRVGVEFEEKELPIEPYFLGVWLGDGTSRDVRITNPDKEIKNYLKKYSKKLHLNYNEYFGKNNCPCLSITGKCGNKVSLQKKMRELGVLENKHIPDIYLYNSKSNRLELLAGLIDTDGYNCKNGCYEIVQKSDRLSNQIKYLANSLGFRAIMVKKISTIKSIGFSGGYNRISISGNINKIPIKVKRKKITDKKPNKSPMVTGIEIDSIGIGEYFGFTLDGDGQFLLSDMTVSHNSAFAAQVAYSVMRQHPDAQVKIFSLEMSADEYLCRLVSHAGHIPYERLRNGTLEAREINMLTEKLGVFHDSLLEIDDRAMVDENDVKRGCLRSKSRGKLALVIVDYLQLMGHAGRTRDRYEAVSDMSRDVKVLAKTLRIPVLMLAQMNRQSEERKAPEPKLSDLRDSGCIEQDADTVTFLVPEAEESRTVRAWVKKNRHGRLGYTRMDFDGNFMTFREV